MDIKGNDGAKTPVPNKDEGMMVEFLPTCHQYNIAHIPKKDLVRKPQAMEQFAMELGCLGADGWLMVAMFETPDESQMMTCIFARSGLKVPKVPKGKGGIINPHTGRPI